MVKRSKVKNQLWGKYAFEFLTVFAGVTLAFVLNTWNENRKDRHSETKILVEIQNGLRKDTADIRTNMIGHQKGLQACNYFRRLVRNEKVEDSLAEAQFLSLLRDFISLQNKSGYESLKSKGLETITNDSLRMEIIAVYDFYFQAIEKLEEQYVEGQFYAAYFQEMTEILAPYMVYNQSGNLLAFRQPVQLSVSDENKMLTYLSKIEYNRNFTLNSYDEVRSQAVHLIKQIDEELKRK
jgi:hypothetical protein